MSVRLAKVKCPRCRKLWTVHYPNPYIECDCHLYCSDGSEVSDCSVSLTPYNWSGQLGWPEGADLDSEDEGDDVLHRAYYCSTHGKYIEKTPVIIEVDWDGWFDERAKPRYRLGLKPK